MSNLSRRAAVGLVSWLFAFAPLAPRANMLTNASFENGPPVPAGRLALPAGSTTVTGWTVIGAPIDVVSTALWQAAEGARSMALNSTTAPGGIEQVFATEPGAVYDVRFFLSGEPFTTPVLKHLRIAAAGQHQDYEYDSTDAWHWDMFYEEHTWSFTAQAATTTIQFVSLTNGFASPVVDHVEVMRSPVDVLPDPSLAFGVQAVNPVRRAAAFTVAMPAAGPAAVTVHDARGRLVSTLLRSNLDAGTHAVQWDARDRAPGVYFIGLHAAGRTATRKLTLLH
jgi:choice-of-anchor C domain-containing protein